LGGPQGLGDPASRGAAIDCGDRTATITVTKDQDGPAVLQSVVDKLEQAFGTPDQVPEGDELRTDHGPQYTGQDCTGLWDAWNLDHTFAPVGRPTGNAVAERCIRTIKEELVWLQDWDSADELRLACASWLDHYHHHRPHQALGWLTPAEYRASRLSSPLAAAS
jgi:putative transposase